MPRLPDLPAGAPLVIVSPPAPLEEMPVLYGLCRQALRAAPVRGGLRHLSDLALAVGVASRPELGRLLAGALLDRLDRDEAFHRQLAETALVYLDNAGRVEPTASALHVHPNTVKYRVRRFAEITGRHLTPRTGTAVSEAAHWWWALRTWLAG